MTTTLSRPFSSFDPDLVREIVADFAGTNGPLVPVLHALTARFGYIDSQAIPIIAQSLNLSIEEVRTIVILGNLQLDWTNPNGRTSDE